MKNQIFKYLKTYSTEPFTVDRLIVSSYLYINNIQLENNNFLKKYVIEDGEELVSLIKFAELLKTEVRHFDSESLIELFEYVISPSDRVVNGAIYTPSDIRQYVVDQALSRWDNSFHDIKIADIACGCSGFLYTAAKELKRRTNRTYQDIFEYQIFGLDIQDYSVTRSKLLLSLLALEDGEDLENYNFNLFEGDALTFRWEDQYADFDGFEVIVGNPPYVCARNLEDSVKSNLKNWSVCQSGNPDLYIPFFQIGYENLTENGILGFITMNTFFKSLNGRALRRYFEVNKVSLKIIDFGTLQIFKSKSTYTCLCFLENTKREYVEYYKSVNREFPLNQNEIEHVYYSSLHAKKGWNLHNNEVISRIENMGIPFGERFNTRHGIATLKNDVYIFKPIAEDNNYFYLQNEGVFPIEKSLCRSILNSNKLSRSVDFSSVLEKVIFPYNDELKPKLLEEDCFKNQFPMAFAYLQCKREVLAERDRGKGKYEKWFAFGRTQSLEKVENKLFFPKFSDRTPSYITSNDSDLLFYNGQAVIGHSEEDMNLVRRIMESRLFWFYIKTTSKPYSSGYYSLNGTYISHFGIPEFNDSQRKFITDKDTSKEEINKFLEELYNVNLDLK